MNTETRSRNRLASIARLAALALLGSLTTSTPANAQCGCPSPGVPTIQSASMKGNDLHEVRGGCAYSRGAVEIQVYQQHMQRRPVCPPNCPSDTIYQSCINNCQWTTIGTTYADAWGNYALTNIDSFQSVQLIAPQPSQPNGLDGVYTQIRVRSYDPVRQRWSYWANPPFLEAFNMVWPGEDEGQFALVETRVTGASEMHVVVADGPDDGDQPSIALDVDEDTPNFWLKQNPGGTVNYTRYANCTPGQGCSYSWLNGLSPAITVASPPLGRGSEYPYVLGMVTAAKPGGMFIASSIIGPREIPDIAIDVEVDVDINFDLGIEFSLF